MGDAINRLGYQFDDSSALPLRNVLAVGIPDTLGDLPVSELDDALANPDTQFPLQLVTGAGPDDSNIRATPAAPVTASLSVLVQYAWLASIPQPYTTAILRDVIAKLTAAQRELAAELAPYDSATKSTLLQRYGGDANDARLAKTGSQTNASSGEEPIDAPLFTNERTC